MPAIGSHQAERVDCIPACFGLRAACVRRRPPVHEGTRKKTANPESSYRGYLAGAYFCACFAKAALIARNGKRSEPPKVLHSGQLVRIGGASEPLFQEDAVLPADTAAP